MSFRNWAIRKLGGVPNGQVMTMQRDMAGTLRKLLAEKNKGVPRLVTAQYAYFQDRTTEKLGGREDVENELLYKVGLLLKERGLVRFVTRLDAPENQPENGHIRRYVMQADVWAVPPVQPTPLGREKNADRKE